uniref:ATP synthase F0 subunit 8 n=1 Tax=Balta vilis TaxID=1661816 RepID=UPI0027A2AD4F|nr:ATP synthase F0 subunit 8 [Balta vilis]WGO57070.1 ATP synthase F0 subunit 8 [Balta vilis]
MPQMMPMNWLTLYILFLIIFMMFNFINYYNNILMINTSKKNKMKLMSLNWKW